MVFLPPEVILSISSTKTFSGDLTLGLYSGLKLLNVDRSYALSYNAILKQCIIPIVVGIIDSSRHPLGNAAIPQKEEINLRL